VPSQPLNEGKTTKAFENKGLVMTLKMLIFVISTLGYQLFFINKVKIRLFIIPLIWACFITTSTYFLSLAGLLSLGANVTLWLGVIASILVLIKGEINKEQGIKILLMNIVWLTPIIIFYLAVPNDFLFLLWDEVGGWARSQKLIYDTNALLNANSPFSLRSYPPGQQIFQYYITKSTFWSEKNLLLAQNAFIFSALLGLVGALFKSRFWACIVYLTILPIIYFFKFDYNTIYADPLIAAVFAGCLALALKPTEGRADVWVLAICLSGFLLLKDITLVFTALVVFIYALRMLDTRLQATNKVSSNQLKGMIKNLAVCIAMGCIITLSWKWYVSVIGTAKTEVIRLTLDGFMQEPYRQRAGTTITAFINALLKPGYFIGEFKKLPINFSILYVMLMTIGLSGLIVLISPKEKKVSAFLIVLACAAGAIGYLLFLLWLYLTYFTEYEGTRLASFDRYSMTYLLAWLLVTFAWFMSVIATRFKNIYVTLIPLGCALLVYCFVPAKFYSDIKQLPLDQVSLEKRKATQALSDQVRKYIKPGEKVYFLAQNSNGYERHLFDYAMLPYPPNDCWSVGKKYNEGDVWTCDRPLGLLLKDYSYLAIYAADERFWKDNAELFDPNGVGRARGVYKINVTPSNQYRLQLVSE
jgi:hypothetical protein